VEQAPPASNQVGRLAAENIKTPAIGQTASAFFDIYIMIGPQAQIKKAALPATLAHYYYTTVFLPFTPKNSAEIPC